jgi:hypothetical protein
MPIFDHRNINRQTIVTRDGDPYFRLVCYTFGGSAVEVDKWSPSEKKRAIPGRR